MFEVLFSQTPALFIPILAIFLVGVVFTVWIMFHHWRSAKQLEVDAALKQDMLTRGLSAADIERVLWASSSGPHAQSALEETITDNEYYLIEKMLDDGHGVEEIERVIRAFRGNEDRVARRAAERAVH